MKPFVPSRPYTVGVEEEYQLCDPRTGDLVQRVDDVFALAPPQLMRRLTYELLLSVMETNTEVCRSPAEIVRELTDRRKVLSELIGKLNVSLAAQGTHPFADYRQQQFVNTDHYRWVAGQCGELARRNLSFGMHVHVGVDDPDGAIYVMHELKRWVGPMLALSVNSPIFEGKKTVLASTRVTLFGRLPRTTYPPGFKTYAELEEYVDRMLASKLITRPGDLWWNIRVQPPLGTVEVRVFDCPTELWRTGALAALTQALVKEYLERFRRGEPLTDYRLDYLEQNYWSGTRFALDGPYLDPTTGHSVPMRDAAGEMLALAQRHVDELGSRSEFSGCARILTEGTEADRLLRWFDECRGDLTRLQQRVMRLTLGR